MKNYDFKQISSTKEGAGFMGHIIKAFAPISKTRILDENPEKKQCSISLRNVITKTELIDIAMKRNDHKNTGRWLSVIANGDYKEIVKILPEIGVRNRDLAISAKTSKEVLSHTVLYDLQDFIKDESKNDSYIGKLCNYKLSTQNQNQMTRKQSNVTFKS